MEPMLTIPAATLQGLALLGLACLWTLGILAFRREAKSKAKDGDRHGGARRDD